MNCTCKGKPYCDDCVGDFARTGWCKFYEKVAPEPITWGDYSVFLAGGISNCRDWQREFMDKMK